MSIPVHVVPRQVVERKSERDRAVIAKQLLLGRYLDPWGTADIVWCHSHAIVRGYKVILNVYDLLPPRLNGCLSVLRLGGAFHSGIQVGTTEYAFGGHINDDLGITALKKPLFVLREDAEAAVRRGEDEDGSAAANLEWMPMLRSRTVVGWWMGPLSELEELLRELRFDELWIGSSYQLLSRNCNHFARAMCGALLRNPLFKPAPGYTRLEDMVPRSVTRLPSLVLALGSCAPCVVRRLNAPMPLASHALNTFQGQGRKVRLELAPSRSMASGRVRSDADGVGTPIDAIMSSASASASAGTAASVGGAVGVWQSSASPTPGLHVGVGLAGGGGKGGIPAVGGCALGSAGEAQAAAAVAATAAVAAAAAEGRVVRQRLEGRYHSLCVETVVRTSTEGPPRSGHRRCTEDGGGGTDTPTNGGGTCCSTPDLAATAAAAAAAAAAAVGSATTSLTDCGGQVTCNGRLQPPPPPPFEHPASPSIASATKAAAPDGPTATSTAATTTATSAIATAPMAAAALTTQTTGLSVSLASQVLVLESAGGAATSGASASSIPSTAAAAAPASGGTAATPQRSSAGPKFLNNSRSGRRVFPDPRVAQPGSENIAAVSAHDSVPAFTSDSGCGLGAGCGPGAVTIPGATYVAPESSSPQEFVRSDPEVCPSAATRGEVDSGQALRLHAVSTVAAISPRQPSRSQQQGQHTPHSFGNDLPPLGQQLPPLQRPDVGSSAKLPPAPLPPPSTMTTQLQQQQPAAASPLNRAAAVTADGTMPVVSGGGGGGTQHPQSEPPRPWSVLSGGFIDLLFNPSSLEPPPGVPHPAAVSRTGTGTGGGGGGGSSRHYSSFTGDGGGIFSGTSNANLGALATVNSGDLSDDDAHEGLMHKAPMAARNRASTGMLRTGGIGGDSDAAGSSGGGVGSAADTGSVQAPGIGATAAAAISPLRPASAVSHLSSKATAMASAPGAPAGVMGASAARGVAAAVAALAEGNGVTPSAAGRKVH